MVVLELRNYDFPVVQANNATTKEISLARWQNHYSKARILRTRIIRIRAYSEVISIPRQNPFKMIRKNEG